MTTLLRPGAAALLFAATLATGCGRGAHETPAADHGPALTVAVIQVVAADAGAVVLPARVAAREEVTLTARMGAQLTALPVREGASFRRGQTLAAFDAPETRAALDGALAGLEAATVARDLARRQEARMESLYATRVAALREVEGAHAERRAAEAAWAQARAQAGQIGSATRLTAPFDGVVARRHVDVGATVGPGQPLLDVRSTGAGEITVSIPESALEQLTGARAEVQVGDGPWHAATLVRVDGMTDWSTRSRTARFRVPDGMALDPGTFARVRLAPAVAAVTAPAAGLRVPATALVRRGGLTGVYVVEDDVARLRWLRVGRQDGAGIAVLAGLTGDEKVIADPAGLSDGRAVKVAR
jgi:RND family efflux transporter MFP subunit